MEKKELKKEAGRLFKESVLRLHDFRCEVCGGDWRLTAHHFFPRSMAGHMIYLIENGIALCGNCHFAHHFRGDPRIHQTIVSRRRQEWYNKLEAIKNTPQKPSYQTKEFYENSIKALEDLWKISK